MLRLSDFKKNNLWVTLGVLVAVLILLFLPDFIKGRSRDYVDTLRKGGSSTKSVVAKSEPSSERESGVKVATEENGSSSTDRAAETVGAGYEQFVQRLKGSGPRTNRKLQEFVLRYGATDGMDIGHISVPAEEQTWDRLKSRAVKKSIATAQNGIKILSARLVPTHPQLSDALQGFVFLLDGFYDAEAQGLDALGVVQAIEDQEYQVTQQMISVGVPRLVLIDWARISLSKLYGNTLMLEFKVDAIPQFRPNFALTKVRIWINKRDVKGPDTQLKSYRLSLKGRLYGSDFKMLRILHQGDAGRTVDFGPDPENSELFHFDLDNIDAAGIYRFVFMDRFGATFERIYSFDPRHRQVRWNSEDENTMFADLPPQDGAGTRFLGDREDFSGRLDSYYRFDRGGSGDGFVVPQNDGGFSSGNNNF